MVSEGHFLTITLLNKKKEKNFFPKNVHSFHLNKTKDKLCSYAACYILAAPSFSPFSKL